MQGALGPFSCCFIFRVDFVKRVCGLQREKSTYSSFLVLPCDLKEWTIWFPEKTNPQGSLVTPFAMAELGIYSMIRLQITIISGYSFK